MKFGSSNDEYYDAHYDSTNRIRGEVIVSTISLEKLMDEVIARYFCPNKEKRTELLEIVVFP